MAEAVRKKNGMRYTSSVREPLRYGTKKKNNNQRIGTIGDFGRLEWGIFSSVVTTTVSVTRWSGNRIEEKLDVAVLHVAFVL